MNVNVKKQGVIGALWLFLGLWTLTLNMWVGVAMIILAVAYLGYAVRRAS